VLFFHSELVIGDLYITKEILLVFFNSTFAL